LGPVHYTLALIRQQLGDRAGMAHHLERALKDAELFEARLWIEKVLREMPQLAIASSTRLRPKH
jgi:hypothetical protein